MIIVKKYVFFEVLFVALSVVFIVASVSNASVHTSKTASELSSSIIDMMSTDDINERDINFVAEKYSIDTSVFSSVSCYSSDDVMNVSELLVCVFNDSSDESILTLIEKYSDERYNLYNGYAQKQSALISNCIISIDSGALFFCVDENAEKIYSHFLEIV